jgi:hypothetical protein
MSAPAVVRTLRDNGLSVGFGVLFLVALAGQAVTGQADYNSQQLSSGGELVSLGHYLVSSSFAVDVAENWQSEYLHFFLYIFATVWLLQRGSPESKEIGQQGSQSDEQQRMGRNADPNSPRWVLRELGRSVDSGVGRLQPRPTRHPPGTD